MQKYRNGIRLLFAAAMLAGGIAQAQTVTVAPGGYVTAGPGATQQYTATVTGATGSTAVIWLAGGVVGGSATAGTISSTGLYTAPANIPAYTGVTITAELASNLKKSGSQAITLLTAGPQITSITPNPLPSGTVNITITGSGFLAGATAMDGAVQLSATVVNSTTMTSSVYHPAGAPSATFKVRNVLSTYGNSITVPIGTGATGSTGSTGSVNAPAISPSSVTVTLGKTQQFTAAGATSWTAVNGTVTSSGLYTAPSTMPTPASDTVTAINSAGQSSATVTLQTNLAPTISPAAVTVTLGKTQQFTAAGATSWKAVSGTVTSAGLYTAPAAMPAPGTDTVTALNAAGQSVATVTLLTNKPPVITPASVTVTLGKTQQFTAAGAASWTAVAGTVTSTGLYTAPATMPSSGADTVTALNAAGQSSATIALLTNIPPAIVSIGTSPLPLGVFSTTVTGTGFTAKSQATLGAVALTTSYVNPTTLNVSGFAGPASTANLTVANGSLVSAPFAVSIGVPNAVVSPSAARRFLEQAGFGPTPADAAHVQAIGLQAWINEQLAMPAISNYNSLINSSQGGMAEAFLANAVTNPDQLRQRVAFALSEIFTISITKIIWNGDMIPYEQMLINDSFTNYGKILNDVTLSPGMGEYLDMANNAAANPAAGTVANENYAREIMQLFSVGDVLLNQDGTVQTDSTGAPLPTYLQPTVAELARVFTGWTYTQGSNPPNWGAYINSSGPMVPYPPMHDFGSKTLLNGYVAPANLTMQQDLTGALNAIISHPNVAPFISKQLIQHLVKSNPSPAYVQRVVQAFSSSNGDMPTVITAILLDPEARANDAGGNEQAADGHLQEPALFVPGFVRAFSGTMTSANYYQQTLAQLGQDIYNPASVFSYFSPGYAVPGASGLLGPEFEIDSPNAAVLRENLVAEFFNQWSNPVQSNGPGTVIDLTPFLPLAATPQTLVSALDLTLTHGTMPATMNQIITNAVTQDASYGALHQVEEAVYLILQSSYYNVWH